MALGYPLETAEASDYDSLKWGSGDIDKTTTPVWATFRHGAWITELMGGGSGIPQFRIVGFSGYPDSITAKTWNGATLGADVIQIAKPFLVRRMPFDNKTVDGKSYQYTGNIARTAAITNPSSSEKHTGLGKPSMRQGESRGNGRKVRR